ncbi:MAG TPA: hypothetical protein VM537_07075, partial [Anaerolineae bacterium]|nr:hypothetical protein [Anaerolineae bacterium]
MHYNRVVMSQEATLFKNLLEKLPPTMPPEDVGLIRHAYEVARDAHADAERASGEAYINHPLKVATILAE